MRRHPTKNRTGHKWSPDEEKQLSDEIEKKITMKQISFIHRRSIGSILSRMIKLGLHVKEIPYEIKDCPILEPIHEPTPKPLLCVFDTETTGLPPFKPITMSAEWPHMIQFACMLYEKGNLVRSWCTFIKPDGFIIPEEATKVNHITNEMAQCGMTISEWCDEFSTILSSVHTLVAHNMMFDNNIIQSELYRAKQFDLLEQFKQTHKECSMMMGKRYLDTHSISCRLNLTALCQHFCIPIPEQLHRADVDTLLCSTLYYKLKELGISNQRTDLHTMFQDKDIVKYLGAKWDAGQRKWYIYDSDPFSSYVKKWFTR